MKCFKPSNTLFTLIELTVFVTVCVQASSVEDDHLHLVRRHADSGEVINRLLFKRAPEDDDEKPRVKKGRGGKKKVVLGVTTAAPSKSTSTTTKSPDSTTLNPTSIPSGSSTKEPSSSSTKRPSSSTTVHPTRSTTKNASRSTTADPTDEEKQIKEKESALIDEAEEALFDWAKFMQKHSSRTRNLSRAMAYYRFVGYNLKRYLRETQAYNNNRPYTGIREIDTYKRKDRVPSRRQILSLY